MNSISNKKIILGTKYRFVNHLFFWIAYLLFSGIVFHFGTAFQNYHSYISAFIIDFVTIYIILLIFIPRFIEKKYLLKKFAFSLFVVVFINLLINFVLQNFIYGNGELEFWNCVRRQSHSIQLSVVFIAIAIGIKIFKLNQENQEQIHELKQAKITSELDFLKTQMNPHFLFNVLNNIYIQTRIDPKKSAEMILKLSDLLRYQLYECSQDKVMLKSEVDYLHNYVDLQKMRITNIELKFEQSGSFRGLMIYPFMFIPFLENAFKHGVSSKGVDNFIHIFVEIVEKYVIFAVKNSKIGTSPEFKNNSGGIGLINIKRRLELLYKGNYELKIEDRENYYYVKLKIDLK